MSTPPPSGAAGATMERYLPPLSPAGARWARFLALLCAAIGIAWTCHALRSVLTPIVVALAIAYILNPLITLLERFAIRRITSIIALYAVSLVLGVVALLLFIPALITQVDRLIDNLPNYLAATRELIVRFMPSIATQPATSRPGVLAGLQANEPAVKLLQEHGLTTVRTMLVYAIGLISSATAWITAGVLIPMYTFFFLWRFNRFTCAVHDHLPAKYRPTIVRVVTTIDQATADFFRGRLLICLAVAVITAIGWTIAGVPYPLLLAALLGVLNLVPFMSIFALPPALILTYMDTQHHGESWVAPVIWVMAVYMAAQAIENFLLSPYICAQTSGLHPITTVIALLIGAELAGVLGMLLSIPLASTLKSLSAEFLMPELRRLAAEPPSDTSAVATEKKAVP